MQKLELKVQGGVYNCEILSYHLYVVGYEKRDVPLRAKCDFLPFFKLSPFQGLKSHRHPIRQFGPSTSQIQR